MRKRANDVVLTVCESAQKKSGGGEEMPALMIFNWNVTD